jgi:hypothetical protein
MEFLGIKFRLEVVVVSVLLGYLIGGFLLCSCSKVGLREGLAGASSMIQGKDEESTEMPAPAMAGPQAAVESDWSAAAAAAQADVKPYQYLTNNKGGKIPLPEGQMFFFYDNSFKPECCTYGNGYSSSDGCACLSTEQAEYLNSRGGNRAAPTIF